MIKRTELIPRFLGSQGIKKKKKSPLKNILVMREKRGSCGDKFSNEKVGIENQPNLRPV